MSKTILSAFVAAAFVCVASAAGPESKPSANSGEFIWWEGENPKESNFPDKSEFSPVDDDEKSHLSGGAWLSANGGRVGQPALFAKYEINVTKEGNYAFWTRKFWKHGPFKWRFDDQPWKECPWDCGLADNEAIRKFVNANWVYLGDVTLTAGKHLVQVEATEVMLEKPKAPEAPAAPEYEAKQIAEWCKMSCPKGYVKAGQELEITVESKGIAGKYRMLCGMANVSGGGQFIGHVEDAPFRLNLKAKANIRLNLKVFPTMAGSGASALPSTICRKARRNTRIESRTRPPVLPS